MRTSRGGNIDDNPLNTHRKIAISKTNNGNVLDDNKWRDILIEVSIKIKKYLLIFVMNCICHNNLTLTAAFVSFIIGVPIMFLLVRKNFYRNLYFREKIAPKYLTDN